MRHGRTLYECANITCSVGRSTSLVVAGPSSVVPSRLGMAEGNSAPPHLIWQSNLW